MAIRYDGIPTGYKSKLRLQTLTLRHIYRPYLLVYITDNILSNDLPIMSGSFGWWRDPDGREKDGECGSYPCRVRLNEGQCFSYSHNLRTAHNLERRGVCIYCKLTRYYRMEQ
jgi:hypothetical protein